MNETIVTPETSQAEPPASQKRLREILQGQGLNIEALFRE